MAQPKHRYYSIWTGIKARCYTPGAPGYAYAGALGHRMHDPWRMDYDVFEHDIVRDIGHKPSLKHKLYRKDPTADFKPGNMVWLTSAEYGVIQIERKR